MKDFFLYQSTNTIGRNHYYKIKFNTHPFFSQKHFFADNKNMSEMRKRIIYIDDDYQSGLLCKVFLEKANFHVDLCLNTKEARDLLPKEPIDMVITDIGLPGENGIQFYEWFTQSQFKEIPILMVSAHAIGFNEVLTKHRDIFFEKPIFFPTLIQHIKKILGVTD